MLLQSRASAPFGTVCKVSDFGLSRVLNAGATHRSTRTFGTLTHTSPVRGRRALWGRVLVDCRCPSWRLLWLPPLHHAPASCCDLACSVATRLLLHAPAYHPQEVLRLGKMSPAADVYSFGERSQPVLCVVVQEAAAEQGLGSRL